MTENDGRPRESGVQLIGTTREQADDVMARVLEALRDQFGARIIVHDGTFLVEETDGAVFIAAVTPLGFIVPTTLEA